MSWFPRAPGSRRWEIAGICAELGYANAMFGNPAVITSKSVLTFQ
jgi:hypothetical protein